MQINGFEIESYNIHGIKEGATTWTCPECSHTRSPKNQKQKCMSVFWDTGLGQCNHCGARVQLHTFAKKDTEKDYKKPTIQVKDHLLTDNVIRWGESRGFNKMALKRLKIGEVKTWLPKANKNVNALIFPYFFMGELVNVKYRGKNKDFRFDKGCEKIMFNLDAILHTDDCVIVEGEPDAIAYDTAGVANVVSVPNGFTLPRKDGTSTINTSYLDDYYHIFESKDRIYLAVDNDEAGRHGQKEIIIRFGAEKCWLVDFKDCKDANEYLLKYGPEELKKTIDNAEQVPLDHVETVKDYRDKLENFYINGSPKGLQTLQMKELDENYSIEFSQFCVITGPPQSGKSEVLDSLTISYALQGHKIAYASPENKPNYLHTDKILRKILGYRPTEEKHVNSRKFRETIDFINDNFYHVEFDDGYELKKTLSKFTELVKRKNIRIFCIDPFNKVRLKSAVGKNVNEYTLEYLNEIDIFCKKNNAIVYLVAHPTKMQKQEGKNTYKMPTAYDIKGGGEFFDMSYHIIGVVRDFEYEVVRIKTLKVKFLHLGSNEKEMIYNYNINSGRYHDVDLCEETGEKSNIQFDNHFWLESDQEPEPEQTQPIKAFSIEHVQDNDNYDDIEEQLPYDDVPF